MTSHPEESLPDVVQFSSPVYYCEEDDEQGALWVDVVRLGTATTEASVQYSTVDGSARAGTKYVATMGTLNFAAGETRKHICVPILQNETFDTSLEFEMHLAEPVRMQLGLYLYKCRIIITDMDTFPTNRFWKDLHECRHTKIPRWSLMWEYIRMNFKVPALRRAFLWNALGDQLLNFRLVWTVLLFNHLVDDVLNAPEPPEDTTTRVYTICGLLLVPHVVLVLNDCVKSERRIRGLAINQLQGNLMRKFLNYDEASRHTVSTSDLVMAITRDVPELVDDAFLSLMAVLTNIGRLALLAGLQIYQSSGVHAVSTAMVLVLYPLVLVSFLCLRHKRTERLRRAFFSAQTEIVTFVQQTTDCYRLISDYMQRPRAVRSFQNRISAYNNAAKDLMVWDQVNSRFAPFLTTLAVSLVMLVTYRRVLGGSLPLGQFISGIGVCESIGRAYESIHVALVQMQRATAPLLNVVFYMNLPVDSHERLLTSHVQLEEARQLEHTELHPESESEDCRGILPQDRLPILGQGLTYSYPDYGGDQSSTVQILRGAEFRIPQGSLVAITGGRASGKATLLKLLSGVLMPSGVERGAPPALFVPPHLRVLHVSQQVQFMADLNVYDNICFGLSDSTSQETLERTLEICRRLALSEAVLDLIRKHQQPKTQATVVLKLRHGEQGQKHRGTATSVAERNQVDLKAHWSSVLSHTDRCMIHMARALVMNPEVLVVHQPLSHFDDGHKKLVMALLREFVDERGVAQPQQSRMTRRPRTCIFSASSSESSELVDMVLHVTQQKVERLDLEALSILRRLALSLIKTLDLNHDSRVSLDEFCEVAMRTPWVSRLLGVDKEHLQTSGEARLTLANVFRIMDVSGSGSVDIQELVQYLRRRLDSDLSRMLVDLKDHLSEPGQYQHRPGSHWAEDPAVAQEEVYPIMPRQEPRMRKILEALGSGGKATHPS